MKLSIQENAQIYIYTTCIDMRKSIDGLTMLLVDVYQQNPMQGDLFVFTNKQRNKIKMLFWDKNGFVLYYKRLEKGKFNYSKYIQEDKIVINATQLRALFVGLDFYLIGEYSVDFAQDFF
jgi:transposase